MPAVTIRAAASRDLINHFVYLAENASVDVAERFLASAESTFSMLSVQPSMGAPLALRHPRLAGMRKWRVMHFEKFLIFYLARRGGVSIARVLHAAQDWQTVLRVTP